MAKLKIKPGTIAIAYNDGVFTGCLKTWEQIEEYEKNGFEVLVLIRD